MLVSHVHQGNYELSRRYNPLIAISTVYGAVASVLLLITRPIMGYHVRIVTPDGGAAARDQSVSGVKTVFSDQSTRLPSTVPLVAGVLCVTFVYLCFHLVQLCLHIRL